MRARHRIWGFGPVGWVLCAPLAGLVWVAWTGYDLQHQTLRAIDAVFGTRVLMFVVGKVMHSQQQALLLPRFGALALMVSLLVLHFSVRRVDRWRYGLLAAWSVIEPSMLWLLGPAGWMATPAWWPFTGRTPLTWTLAVAVACGLGTAVCLWIVTRSRLVAVLTAGAVVACYSAGDSMWLRVRLPTPWTLQAAWLAVLGGILAWWVVAERRTIKPEWACQACGYDRRGIGIGLPCPECGTERTSTTPC